MRSSTLQTGIIVLIVFSILVLLRFNYSKIVRFVPLKFNQATSRHVSIQDWTEIFPELKSLLVRTEMTHEIPSINFTTSAKFTSVFLKSQNYVKGGTLIAVIEARDFHNNSKKYGGDFLRAILYQGEVLNKGVSCNVEDMMSGKYNVSCPLLWSGPAQLNITLIHPSESLLILVRNFSGSRAPGITFRGKVKNTKNDTEEFVPCSFSFADILNESQVCNHSNPRNGEPWFCVRSSSGECPPILWMDRYLEDKRNPQGLAENNPYFIKEVNWRASIGKSLNKINIAEDRNDNGKYAMGTCVDHIENIISQNPNAPTGWFSNRRWNSLSCENIQFNKSTLQRCLQNYTLYLSGDSTVRQWYTFLINTLAVKDEGTIPDKSIWNQARNGFQPEYNITLHYRSHGPPLYNSGPVETRPYITDTMEEVVSSATKTIFIFSIGLHFNLFNPNYYYHRVRGIREAVIRLRQRSPGIRFFVKGLHAHSESNRLCLSDWQSYRHDRILRHVFKDVTRVIFLPYWDMTSVLDNEKVHPGTRALAHEIGLLQSYMCSQ